MDLHACSGAVGTGPVQRRALHVGARRTMDEGTAGQAVWVCADLLRPVGRADRVAECLRRTLCAGKSDGSLPVCRGGPTGQVVAVGRRDLPLRCIRVLHPEGAGHLLCQQRFRPFPCFPDALGLARFLAIYAYSTVSTHTSQCRIHGRQRQAEATGSLVPPHRSNTQCMESRARPCRSQRKCSIQVQRCMMRQNLRARTCAYGKDRLSAVLPHINPGGVHVRRTAAPTVPLPYTGTTIPYQQPVVCSWKAIRHPWARGYPSYPSAAPGPRFRFVLH